MTTRSALRGILLGSLLLGAGLADAQTASLSFQNSNSELLSVFSAEGLTGGDQVDSLGQTVAALAIDTGASATYNVAADTLRATLVFDGGRDLYRFEGTSECAGLLTVDFRTPSGQPLEVADARIVAATPDAKGAYVGQAVTTTGATTSERLLVRGAGAYQVDVRFALGSDGHGRAATFSRRLATTVGCDQSVRLVVQAGAGSSAVGASDLMPADGHEILPSRRDARSLLDAELANGGSDDSTKSARTFAPATKNATTGESSFCTTETFDGADLPAVWGFDLMGDALTGSASLTGTGRLSISGSGSSLYHGSDNAGFVHQTVSGDFRSQVTLIDVPVDQGGDFRKTGLMVRQSLDPNAPRVMVQLVVNHPVYQKTALQFDFRNAAGEALELASTPVDLSLPLSIAIDRRGDLFTAYFSTDNGASWIKPAGGVGQGQIEIPMGPSALVGVSATSYDTNLALTAEYDDFRLCRRTVTPTPDLPPALGCQAGRKLDLIYLLDASGSMTAAFPGADTKLEAVADAIAATNTALGANFPGSRSSLISYRGAVFSDPAYNLANGAQVLQALTTDLSAVSAAAAAIDPSQIHPDANTPAPIALDLTRQTLLDTHAEEFLPVLIWLTDGAPNIDINGFGPLEYRFTEILPLSIRDGAGNFLPWSQITWLGNFNGGIGTYDGEVFGNTVFQTERLKGAVPDLLIYPVAIRGEDTFYEDLLAYAAYYTGTQLFTVDDTTGLAEAMDQVLTELDCGATIGDFVWRDLNGDGVQDAGETGIAGVTVELVDGSGNVVATTTTDASGLYLFEDVIPGTYTVRVDASTLPADATIATFDLDGLATLHEASVTVAAREQRLDVDFGYQAPASIGDRVWLDTNGDGVQDAGETGIAGVTVELRDASGTVIATTTTGADGEYLFDGLAAGTYTVTVVDSTLPTELEGPTYDLDGIATAHTAPLSVAPGDARTDVDFGYAPAGSDCVEGFYRDDFATASFANQDGDLDWSGDWQEFDPYAGGVSGGQVQVHSGFLTLTDNPDTGYEPSAERTADLGSATGAELSFKFLTSYAVDYDDAVTVEISTDGGVHWTALDVITNITGEVAQERSYNLDAYTGSEVKVRFRVSNFYGGTDELFCIDWIEIRTTCETGCTGNVQVRDDFNVAGWGNQDGASSWAGNWQEFDPTYAGVGAGQVQMHDGFLTLNDSPNTGYQPSAERGVDLSGMGSATLSFKFLTSYAVDYDDAVTVEISSDGGANWTTLEVFTNITGEVAQERSYDISAYATSQTRVRFRVSAKYGGAYELFCIDWIEIVGSCDGTGDDNHCPGTLYTGYLNGTGAAQWQPDGGYYWSDGGVQEGWLEGDGYDFDLVLFKWDGYYGNWVRVDRSINAGSSEHVAYTGSAGYYTWKVKSYQGYGNYNLWISYQ